MRAVINTVLGAVVLFAGCTSAPVNTRAFAPDAYRVGESSLSANEQTKLFTSIRNLLACLDAIPEVECGLKLNAFDGERRNDIRKYFSGDAIDRIWTNSTRTEEQVLVEFPWPDQGAGGVLLFGIISGRFVPYGATLVMP